MAHPAAPSHVSALMSGVMIKLGIYGLLRVVLDLLGGGPAWWGGLVLGVGVVSALLGVLYALMEHDLKRLLAYHSVENIGIILIGIGAGLIFHTYGLMTLAALGFVGGLYHTLNHAAFKGLLFLGAGSVLHATHTRNMEEMGGLIKRMPWTALFFLVGAAAISALPPLNGFVSEWLVFQALLAGFQHPQARAGRSDAGGGGHAGADQRPGGGLLRQSLWHLLPGHSALARGRTRARSSPGRCGWGWASWRWLCVALGVAPVAGRAAPGQSHRRVGRLAADLPAASPSTCPCKPRARLARSRRLWPRWACW